MRFESVPVTADGTQIPYEFTDSRVESTDAEVVCLVGNGRDVSP